MISLERKDVLINMLLHYIPIKCKKLLAAFGGRKKIPKNVA